MIKIAIAGGPGSGKSSLARLLTTELYNIKNINAQLITEFARDYINNCVWHEGFTPSLADQQLIYNKQIEREDTIPDNVQYLISDSPIFIPLIFSKNLAKLQNYQDRTIYLNLYEDFLSKHLNRYDFIFFINRQKAFLKDGTRHETEEQADNIGKQIHGFLTFHKVSFIELRCISNTERVKEVLQTLCFV